MFVSLVVKSAICFILRQKKLKRPQFFTRQKRRYIETFLSYLELSRFPVNHLKSKCEEVKENFSVIHWRPFLSILKKDLERQNVEQSNLQKLRKARFSIFCIIRQNK